jgi:uncharacterized protein
MRNLSINWSTIYQRRWALVYLPSIALAFAAFVWLGWFVFPLAPGKVTITSGAAEGMYHQHAKRYAEYFKNHGLEVDVLTSAGSAQNLERLRDTLHPAQVGFVQGGFGQLDRAKAGANQTGIQILANVDIEPVWVFSRVPSLDSLQQLQGLRVSIGAEGSGSRVMALQLLAQVRLEPKDFVPSEASGMAAAKALEEGKLDVAIFVAAAKAPIVKTMLNIPGVHLVQLKHSTAITERLPYLGPRLIAQGMLDNATAQPAKDMILLTTMASVVASENLHPAIKRLTTAAAMEIHNEATVLSRAGEFPTLKQADFPTAPEARNTLLHGLPWIEQKLSVSQAQWFWRFLFLALPLALFAWLVCSVVPAYLRWILETHINRWYGELKFIEYDMEQAKVSGVDAMRFSKQLQNVDTALSKFEAPQDFMQRLYMLRQHINFVRQKLTAQSGR